MGGGFVCGRDLPVASPPNAIEGGLPVADTKKSLGDAIDEIVAALEALPEPSRLVAIRAACEHVGMPLPGATLAAGAALAPAPLEVPATQVQDIRGFKEQKRPATAIEMACVVAYYLRNVAPQAERKAVVTADDMQRYFVQGNFPLPKALPQLLPNTKAAGYVDALGGGSYRLNAVGHNLVAHSLPRGERAGAVDKKLSKGAARRGRKPAKKKGAKRRVR